MASHDPLQLTVLRTFQKWKTSRYLRLYHNYRTFKIHVHIYENFPDVPNELEAREVGFPAER
jgi:hypothetical protein